MAGARIGPKKRGAPLFNKKAEIRHGGEDYAETRVFLMQNNAGRGDAARRENVGGVSEIRREGTVVTMAGGNRAPAGVILRTRGVVGVGQKLGNMSRSNR